MGSCHSPREHSLWHAPFYSCWPLDEHTSTVEDRFGHGALRASPPRTPAMPTTAIASISRSKGHVAPLPSSSSSSLEAD